MSEAYEIGVTLALSDGVSEAIERARRDMAQFETALASAGVTVQQLRRAAVGAVAPHPRAQPAPKVDVRPVERAAEVVKAAAGPGAPVPEVARESRGVSRVVAEGAAGPPVRAAAAPAVVMAREGNVVEGRPADAPSAPVRAPVAALVGAAGSVAAAPLPQASEGGVARFGTSVEATGTGMPGGGPATSQGGVVQVFAAAPVTLARPDVSPVRGAAPGVTAAMLPAGLVDPGVPPARASVPIFRATAVPVSAALAATARVPVPGDAGEAPRPTVRAPIAVPRQEDGAGERMPVFQFGSAASAPGGPPGFASGAADAANTGGKRTPEPGAAQAGAQSPGPTEGDVFLDGMLVGRWIARFLADGAGRAPAGPTGFDGRRGRILPGPTVGN